MKTKLMIAVAAASLALAGAAAAEEQTWRSGSAFVIRAHDLDLAKAADRERLLKRLEFAAARQCVDMGVRRRSQACAATTVANVTAASPRSLQRALTLATSARTDVQLARR